MPELIFAAQSEEVKDGVILAVVVDETPIGLTRINGKACAFHDICTHDDGPLAEGTIEGEEVICPRHGARFNLLTGKATFPAPAPLPLHETMEEEGVVKVKV